MAQRAGLLAQLGHRGGEGLEGALGAHEHVELGRREQRERELEAVTLERLEYCILLDEDGNKRYIRGPAVVFHDVEGCALPLVTNLFGTARRVERAFGSRPGDLIATGTPTGAGARFDPPIWLKPGDVVEVASPGLGVLRNSIEDETV